MSDDLIPDIPGVEVVERAMSVGYCLHVDLFVNPDVLGMSEDPADVRRFEMTHFGGGGGLILTTVTGEVLGTVSIIDARSRGLDAALLAPTVRERECSTCGSVERHVIIIRRPRPTS